MAKDDLELLNLLSSPPKCWDPKHVLPHPVSLVLGVEPRISCMFGKHSTKIGAFCATGGSQTLPASASPRRRSRRQRASGQWTEILPSDTRTADLETTLEDPFGLVLAIK